MPTDSGDKRKDPEVPELIDTQQVLFLPAGDVLSWLDTSLAGLTAEQVEQRREVYGANEVTARKRGGAILQFLSRLRNPLVIILLLAAAISAGLGEALNAIIIFSIIVLSVTLDFFQEYRAGKAAEELRRRIATVTAVVRDNTKQDIAVAELVPGDIVSLAAGDIVPADARVIGARDFFVDQSVLTGESFPAEKTPDSLKLKDTPTVSGWNNYLFMGTSVATGTAQAVVVKTGRMTEYGEIVRKSTEKKPETEFERGLRRFGLLITQVTFILVIAVFFITTFIKYDDALQSLLFAVALAVGLTPELLPMIISINLSSGALSMSRKGVIVKRLAAIQNFGSMDVLCTDKTGTLTQNRVTVIKHVDVSGKEEEKVFLYSFINSSYQTGLRSPLDEAVLRHEEINISNYKKADEIPFDFVRRRVSVVVSRDGKRFMVTKGAPESLLDVCVRYELNDEVCELSAEMEDSIHEAYNNLSTDGFRVLGICYRDISEEKAVYTVDDESEMTFLGFIAFIDPPKESAKESLELLHKSGVEVKILTGDNELVTRKICEQLDIKEIKIVLGKEMDHLTDDVLLRVVEEANIFARVNPAQKNRIMNALRSHGHVVGYLGDGVNDIPSMKVADVSISVENAVDIAKESAEIILLRNDLKVLEDGVLEGRRTFGNTMKYIMMGTSSNFGNMLSAAGASLFLPFLPMLPIQILLNNFLYDLAQLTIPTDHVDREYIVTAKRLDISFIRKFMLFFGPISSIFDFLTFFVLLYFFKAHEPLFQTAWFIESLFTQTLIIFSIRTSRTPFYRSKPSLLLAANVVIMLAVALVMPFSPLGRFFQFVPLPASFLAILAAFVIVYLALAELMKTWFYHQYQPAEPHTRGV